MNITIITPPLKPTLNQALEAFEKQFRYPLGQSFFRIYHGEDYLRFYSSIGKAIAILASDNEGIAGVCCAAERLFHHPAYGPQQVLYIGDLKLAPRARNGRVWWRMGQAIREHYSRIDLAYSVVMDGTPYTPDTYTGRAGLPSFRAIGEIRIWRLGITALDSQADGIQPVTEIEGLSTFRRLAANQCYCTDGKPQLRSTVQPQWWLSEDGQSCALLEDTRSAKRLVYDDGKEIMSAHLSAFAYSDPRSAHHLIQAICHRLVAWDCPGLFLSLPKSISSLPELLEHPSRNSIITGATVYGNDPSMAGNWNIFTAEI